MSFTRIGIHINRILTLSIWFRLSLNLAIYNFLYLSLSLSLYLCLLHSSQLYLHRFIFFRTSGALTHLPYFGVFVACRRAEWTDSTTHTVTGRSRHFLAARSSRRSVAVPASPTPSPPAFAPSPISAAYVATAPVQLDGKPRWTGRRQRNRRWWWRRWQWRRRSYRQQRRQSPCDVLSQYVYAVPRSRHYVALSVMRQGGDQQMAPLSLAYGPALDVPLLPGHVQSNRYATIAPACQTFWSAHQALTPVLNRWRHLRVVHFRWCQWINGARGKG